MQLYLSNKDLTAAGTELYRQKAENLRQKLGDSILVPLFGIVFDQFGSFQDSSIINFLIYENNHQYANDLSREISTEILRRKWLKSLIVYREDGQIVADDNMRKKVNSSVQNILLKGIINYICKEKSPSGWVSGNVGFSDSGKSLIYFIKYPLTNASRNRGIVLYSIDSSYLEKVIRNSVDSIHTSCILEDETGQILFSFGKLNTPSWINATRPENLDKAIQWNGKNSSWQIIWEPLSDQKISLALVVSTAAFRTNLLYAQKFDFLIAIIFIIGIGIYLFFIRNKIQDPLAAAMDTLRDLLHTGSDNRVKNTLRVEIAKIADENKNLIMHRLIVNLITEGMEKKDFIHICEILGVKSSEHLFHLVLVEQDQFLYQDLSWDDREQGEINFYMEWIGSVSSGNTLSIRYHTGGIVCLYFIDTKNYLPIGALIRFAQKTHSNIAFSMALSETIDFTKIYLLLTGLLDNKLCFGYGNVFPVECSRNSVSGSFSIEPLRKLIMGDKHEEFLYALSKEIKDLERNGSPPIILRDYFIVIAGLINETYWVKARTKDCYELSYINLRQEIQNLESVEEFIEWTRRKMQKLRGAVRYTTNDENFELIGKIKRYISSFVDKNITLETTADYFGISSGYLSRLFKVYNSEGFSCYLKEQKLEEAAARIKNRRFESITKLSHELGYSSSVYFSKEFKKRFGVLPHEYAKRSITSN